MASRAVPAGMPRARQQVEAAAEVRSVDSVLLLYWLLRLACAFEFIGHGAFGIITKAAWAPYFGVAGIPEDWAYRLMPVVGSVDVFFGFLTLIRPVRAVLLYMAIWGLWTASLRPLSGEPVWELVERAPNYLVPAALLYLRGLPRPLTGWQGWLS